MGVQSVIQPAYAGKGELTSLCFVNTFVLQFICELVSYSTDV